MASENMLVMTMEMDFVQSMSTLREGFGRYERSWLRRDRKAQEKLPLYRGFFELVHNVKTRGKALLSALLENLLA